MRSGLGLLLAGVVLASFAVACSSERWEPSRGLLIQGATIATMDDDHNEISDGRVLVRDGVIVAVWSGPTPPVGVSVGDAQVITAHPGDVVFPGLINLHSHPSFNVLPAWLPPASHAIPSEGKIATDPYENRYQWKTAPQYSRLVSNPYDVLLCLRLYGEMTKYAEVAALLGGETAIQGGGSEESNRVLVRNVEAEAFARVKSFSPGDDFTTLDHSELVGKDAWIIHIAEGARDSDRRLPTNRSSRAEFATRLLHSLREVVEGGSVVDPQVVEALVARRARIEESALAQLTPRELDVLRQMAQGGANAAIAQALSLSESAVGKHVNSIFAKLGLSHETQLHRRVAAVLTFLRNTGLATRGDD